MPEGPIRFVVFVYQIVLPSVTFTSHMSPPKADNDNLAITVNVGLGYTGWLIRHRGLAVPSPYGALMVFVHTRLPVSELMLALPNCGVDTR